MLSQLQIENIAVIQKACIKFENGFNVFTGETGAGKSILIGAIGAVLGARTSKELIRTGENKASVSALFTYLSENICRKLADIGVDAANGELLLERDITFDSTVCRINGKLSTVAMLKSIGALLIHTHGQQDSQLLADPEMHLSFTDSFGGLYPMIESYRESYEYYCDIRRKLSSLETDEAAKARKIDLLSYQINEINSANLTDGEEEELISRRKMMRNSEKLTELLHNCRICLNGDDGQEGAISLISSAADSLNQAGRYIDDLSKDSEAVSGFGYELEDISQRIREHLDMLDFDPRELDDIEERLDLINKLKKKYGSNIAQILEFAEKAEAELEEIEFSDKRAEELSADILQPCEYREVKLNKGVRILPAADYRLPHDFTGYKVGQICNLAESTAHDFQHFFKAPRTAVRFKTAEASDDYELAAVVREFCQTFYFGIGHHGNIGADYAPVLEEFGIR